MTFSSIFSDQVLGLVTGTLLAEKLVNSSMNFKEYLWALEVGVLASLHDGWPFAGAIL